MGRPMLRRNSKEMNHPHELIECEIRELACRNIEETLDEYGLRRVILKQLLPLTLVANGVREDEQRRVVHGELAEHRVASSEVGVELAKDVVSNQWCVDKGPVDANVILQNIELVPKPLCTDGEPRDPSHAK